MPTKKKRVGVIPREDVMKIIDKLSIDNNLSISKIISILVEEALSIRGIFNKNNDNRNQSYQIIRDYSPNLTDNSADFIENKKIKIDSKLGDHYNPMKSSNLKESDHESFDLQTYKTFLSFLKFQEMMNKYNT